MRYIRYQFDPRTAPSRNRRASAEYGSVRAVYLKPVAVQGLISRPEGCSG